MYLVKCFVNGQLKWELDILSRHDAIKNALDFMRPGNGQIAEVYKITGKTAVRIL